MSDLIKIQKALSLSESRVLHPRDAFELFLRYYYQLELKATDFLRDYRLINRDYLVDGWRSKGREDLLVIVYMILNNMLPVLVALEQEGEIEELKRHIRVFCLEPLDALISVYGRHDGLLEVLRRVRTVIAEEYYWNRTLEYLESQIIVVLQQNCYSITPPKLKKD